jgi:hypothetical protein
MSTWNAEKKKGKERRWEAEVEVEERRQGKGERGYSFE